MLGEARGSSCFMGFIFSAIFSIHTHLSECVKIHVTVACMVVFLSFMVCIKGLPRLSYPKKWMHWKFQNLYRLYVVRCT